MKKILLTLLILAQLVVVAETKKGKAPVQQQVSRLKLKLSGKME